ncbi:MAG: toll/interleukin-1 receptor domain-containing protein [Candidatus Hodarchaeota archaeon]
MLGRRKQMKITIYSEHGLDLDLQCISENISRLAPDLNVVKGKMSFKIKGFFVLYPSSYKQLSRALLRESADSDEIILFTEHPYDNNYFWEELDNKAIISLSGWDHLTNLPRNNGTIFFICATVMQALDIGVRHDENTGCINDFLMDKTGVDLGMRSGSVCSECLADYRSHGNPVHVAILSQIQTILGELGAASRADMDICEYWRMRAEEEDFDVFLCHNSQDKDEVRDMNVRLQAENIRTWFDEEQLPPGRLWQELLEEQIAKIKTAAVFVGQSGMGPWQDIELRAFLSEFVRRRCPVIPVILPKCLTVPQLPLFLKQFIWVDFRKTTPDPFEHLLWGIRGRKT